MQLFSLYDTDINEFYSKLVEFRAIDQEPSADLTPQVIFHHIEEERTKLKWKFSAKLEKEKNKAQKP